MAIPTTAQTQAAIYAARALNLSWSDIAAKLKEAIFYAQMNAAQEAELPWQSVNSDGTSITRIPIMDAIAAYRALCSMDSGGIVSQYVEFGNVR